MQFSRQYVFSVFILGLHNNLNQNYNAKIQECYVTSTHDLKRTN